MTIIIKILGWSWRLLATGLRRIFTSRILRRWWLLLVTAGLVAGFHLPLLRVLGAGIWIPVAAALLLTWIMHNRRLPVFLQAWYRWLGICAFTAAFLGLLAFFSPGYGVFYDYSLGGYGGSAIIVEPGALGALILAALVLVGTACIAPYFSWRVSRDGARRSLPVLLNIKAAAEDGWERLRVFYLQHPLHEMAITWVKDRRKRASIKMVAPSSTPVSDTPHWTDVPDEPDRDAEEELVTATPVRQERPIYTPSYTPSAVSPAHKEPTSHEPAGKPATPQMVLPYLGRWQLPSLELLNETAKAELSQTEIEKRARKIEEALASYAVEAKVVQMNVGPAVTQFGVEPGWDRKVKEIKERDQNGNILVRPEEVSRTRVKVERIKSLENNLALALAATSIRIEAPIPGTSLVGIEVPNTSMGTVSVREVLESAALEKMTNRSKLIVSLGKGTAGEVTAADLTKMPHVLIAGATGSGKTVCLDSVITSLLIFNSPDDLRFVMIDPKRVELTAFNGVPHLLAPVITENEKAVDMLKWVEQEMDSRYRRLAGVGVQNIERYNKSTKVTKPMTFLVVVVDELADLMMAKSDEVEPLLCRLAQMGRAVGIHLVVATQRPSVDVITGLIKANFPTRISFAVVSQIDSRTILDVMGAEKLLGRGDMLYQSSDMVKPKRLQGCFISPEEIDRVVTFWREQAKTQVAELFAAPVEDFSVQDPLLEQARRLAQHHLNISPSFLQRQLRIGLARAEKLYLQIQAEKEGKADAEEISEDGDEPD